MRIRTANNNRRRLVKRARRAAAFRRWADRAALALFPDAKPWFRFDLGRPEGDVHVVMGMNGGGKSHALAMMRERLARGPVAAPEPQSFFNELATFGAAARLVELREDAKRHVEEINFASLFKTMTGEE